MSMRKRAGGSILDRPGYDPELDPHNLCRPMGKPKAERQCYCPVLRKNETGGMVPAVDLENRRVVCRTCRKRIPDSCGRRSVVHLRGLLKAEAKNPQNVDWDSIPDLILD